MACNGASMPATGKADPHMEMLSTDHSDEILIDIRIEGIRPKAKMPKPRPADTCKRVSHTIFHTPPSRGKSSTSKI